MITHGGDLTQAIQRYGRPLARWIDLSTGINPHPWPVPTVPLELWHHLPRPDDLPETAQQQLGFPHALPVPGTQSVIQVLPHLRPPCRVAISPITYAEHALCWKRQGHTVISWTPGQSLDDIDVLVIVNPNNPTGQTFSPAILWDWHTSLIRRGGWLIVDEAFMDATPEQSLLSQLPDFARSTLPPGLVILRGLGKFFGLAGARIGLVGASPTLLNPLADMIGPWPVSGPARWLAHQALQDTTWQYSMRNRLKKESVRLHTLLEQHGFRPQGGTALFQWLPYSHAYRLHDHLAQQGLWTRHFDSFNGLRIGLPPDEISWQHLSDGLLSYRSRFSS